MPSVDVEHAKRDSCRSEWCAHFSSEIGRCARVFLCECRPPRAHLKMCAKQMNERVSAYKHNTCGFSVRSARARLPRKYSTTRRSAAKRALCETNKIAPANALSITHALFPRRLCLNHFTRARIFVSATSRERDARFANGATSQNQFQRGDDSQFLLRRSTAQRRSISLKMCQRRLASRNDAFSENKHCKIKNCIEHRLGCERFCA